MSSIFDAEPNRTPVSEVLTEFLTEIRKQMYLLEQEPPKYSDFKALLFTSLT